MKKVSKIETRSISLNEYNGLQDLKKSALRFFKIEEKEMLLHIGRVAELELCHLKKWELCVKQNNAGYDAINGRYKIQIKAHIPTTPMLGSQKPDAAFDYLVVALYNKENLMLNIAYQVTRKAYKTKLIEVQKKASAKHKKENRNGKYIVRNDISYSEFLSIKTKKQIKLLMH